MGLPARSSKTPLTLPNIARRRYTSAMQLLRFRLSTLLVATAAIAALLGYAQARRLNLNREFAALTASGCPAAFQDSWLWPSVPGGMGITFRTRADKSFTLAAESFTCEEAFGEYRILRDKLHALGVENVWMQTISD
jgi:hypothetical protein